VDAQICSGPCNNGYRRARAIWDDATAKHADAMTRLLPGQEAPQAPAPPAIQPWYGEPVFCSSCTAAIRAALSELDDLASLRMSQLPGSSQPSDGAGRVGGTKGAPSPSPAMDDVDELTSWARDWEAVARGDDPRARRGFLATERTTILAWLTEHVDTLLLNIDVAGDFGDETRKWHRELTEKTRSGTGMKHMKTKCPRCSLYTLWRQDGAPYVQCRDDDCGRMLSLDEYAALSEAA
jgi:hypothetical protein